MQQLSVSTSKSIKNVYFGTKESAEVCQPNSPKHNHLLAQLPASDYLRLLPYMELCELEADDVLHEAGLPFEWIYFPTTAIVCIGYITEDGSMPSVGLVGKDGLIGLACIMGSDCATNYATVQSSGFAYRIKAHYLKKELYKKSDLLRITLLYSQIFFTQISQTAVCNRLHSVDQQLCRYLLMNADLLESEDLYLTHEFIANMLGVRREGITQSAGKLQQKELIRYSRGRIHIINKKGLECEVCECYSVVKDERERLMPTTTPFYFSDSNKRMV